MNTSAVIFDLDGTLIDIETVYLDAHTEILAEYGITYGKPEHRDFLVAGPRQACEELLKDTPLDFKRFNDLRHKYIRDNVHRAGDRPGTAAFLTALQTNIEKLGLATNSPTFDCHQKIDSRPWSKNFDAIVCGDHPEVKKGKPSPDIFLVTAEKLNVDSKDCVVFEDSPFGVEAALAAGMRVIGVQHEYVDRSAFKHAEAVIQDFEDRTQLMQLLTQ